MTAIETEAKPASLISCPGPWAFWYSEIGCFQKSVIKNGKNLLQISNPAALLLADHILVSSSLFWKGENKLMFSTDSWYA